MPDIATSKSITDGGHTLVPSQDVVSIDGELVILQGDIDDQGCTVAEGSSVMSINGVPVAFKGCAVTPVPDQPCSQVATGNPTVNISP